MIISMDVDCFTFLLARHLADVSSISEAIRDVEQTSMDDADDYRIIMSKKLPACGIAPRYEVMCHCHLLISNPIQDNAVIGLC